MYKRQQQRITGFVAGHSHISEARFTELMMHTGELVMDMGSVVDGETAVAEGLIDELGGLGDALHLSLIHIYSGRIPACGTGQHSAFGCAGAADACECGCEYGELAGKPGWPLSLIHI